ncbi:uncharacterized protein K02A2.6-like [Planococcus citri]|uniref:uncharacterized protein K02A2.6-like n=1 Tax=Planococcus citri TaxID=170843 RepID=UPI0031F7D1FA
MNADELQRILAEQNTQFQAILQAALTQSRNTPRTPENTEKFDAFDSKKEKFTNYIARFEDYTATKNITDVEKKAGLLRTSIGSTHYNKLAAFLGPDKSIQNLSYADLKTSFNDLLVPRQSVIISRHYFLETQQKENQNIAEFVASLQDKVVNCQFTVECECKKQVSCAKLFLAAQVVRGIKEPWIKEQVLQTDSDDYDKIVEKAISLEASRIESRELSKNTPNTIPGNSDVNKLSRAFNRDSRSQNRYNDHSKQRNRSHSRGYSKNHYRSNTPAKRRSKIDYKKLGIDGLCLRCGRNNHSVSDCTVDRNKLKCTSCNKPGHLPKVCITTLMSNSKSNESSVKISEPTNYATYSQYVDNYHVVDLYKLEENSVNTDDKYFIEVGINGKSKRMEVDTGAKFSLIPDDEFKKLGIRAPIKEAKIAFRSFSGAITPALGYVTVDVSYKDRKTRSNLYIVPPGHATLMGREWIRTLKVTLEELDLDQQKSNSFDYPVYTSEATPQEKLSSILEEYSELFEPKIGRIPNFAVNLQLRENATPKLLRERTVPYALRSKVDAALDVLEKQGIITPVSSSDWGSPLVVVLKQDNEVRLCIDYKVTVNVQLVDASYPISRVEEILDLLVNATHFCKLDLYQAYMHMCVNEASSIIQTIVTHRGSYRMNRLGPGVKIAPSEFNRKMKEILLNCPGTANFFDDIIVYGSSLEECLENLRKCLEALKKNDLHLNKKKCKFLQEKTTYLGFVIEKGKIGKSPEKMEAVKNLPRPKDADEIRRFIGLITYYHRFIPNLSNLTAPLRALLKKNAKFFWSSECESAFIKLKEEICSDRVVVPFDPMKPLILTTDASPVGVGAVLSHFSDGEERPIAYASRSLTPAEKNYSQLDREALAIIFATTYFYNYLLGKKFTLVTDNEALTRIFASNKNIPQMTSARLIRYACFLAQFNYDVKFKKGIDNQNVDCLSRAPVDPQISYVENLSVNVMSEPTNDFILGNEPDQIYTDNIFYLSNEIVNSATIAAETQKDPELQPLLLKLLTDNSDYEYTTADGIIFRNDRVYVPVSLRSHVLADLHFSHMGSTRMKQLARRYVYWKGIDADIERYVKKCSDCAELRRNPPKEKIHPWDPPARNWERVHMDYLGPFLGYYVLVCVDAKSKWSEVRAVKEAPTSEITINLLTEIFTTHGFPTRLVSDNATIFKSELFQNFCKKNGIHQRFIAPNFPQTNGLAERSVQTWKRRLLAMQSEADSTSIHEKLRQITLRYHATPLASGLSPAEQYLGRKLKISLDAFFPYHEPSHKKTPSVRQFNVGNTVQARIFTNQKLVWARGVVAEKYGTRHYLITLENSGRQIKRHIDQLVPAWEQGNKAVTFGPTQSFDVPKSPHQNTTPNTSAAEMPTTSDAATCPARSAGSTDPSAPPTVRRSSRKAPPPARFNDYIR